MAKSINIKVCFLVSSFFSLCTSTSGSKQDFDLPNSALLLFMIFFFFSIQGKNHKYFR